MAAEAMFLSVGKAQFTMAESIMFTAGRFFTRGHLALMGVALALAAAAAPAGADALDPYPSPATQDAVGLKPGYWELHMTGITRTPHFNVPINRINRTCLKAGDSQKKLFMPKTTGQCQTHEDTDSDGVMHWKWTCTIVNGSTQGTGTVKTSSDHFASEWQVVSTLNLAKGYSTTTTMKLTGKRIGERCPSKR